MKRRAFVLTEILMSMMLQSLFALTLCGAFYMLLSFSTSTQQILAAHDEGEVVVSYLDTRIRNAGLGLWRCVEYKKDNDVTGVGTAFNAASNFERINDKYGGYLKKLEGDKLATNILPVAIVSNTEKGLVISEDGGVYEGNVLNLLYAHEDTSDNDFHPVLQGFYKASPDEKVTISQDGKVKLKFIQYTVNPKSKSNFNLESKTKGGITSWAVMEATGVPVYLDNLAKGSPYTFDINAPYVSADIYPISELLNLECERMYSGKSTNNEDSFMVSALKASTWDTHPHAVNILELHMTLDTNKPVPILTLDVLVSRGRNSSRNTQCPNDWPRAYWRDEFKAYNVHVTRAEWKLYNLAPLFPK